MGAFLFLAINTSMVRNPRPLEPLNTQTLRENKFSLSIARLTAVSYKLTSTTIPGISITPLPQATPFRTHQLPGFKILYDQAFEVTFLIDEALTNWQELHDWMIGIAPPDSFTQYQANADKYGITTADEGQVMSDARLLIYNAQNTLTYVFVIEEMFPTRLSGINFHYSSAEPLTATAAFSYSKFRLDSVATVQ